MMTKCLLECSFTYTCGLLDWTSLIDMLYSSDDGSANNDRKDLTDGVPATLLPVHNISSILIFFIVSDHFLT